MLERLQFIDLEIELRHWEFLKVPQVNLFYG
jgi:hypothetical protein